MARFPSFSEQISPIAYAFAAPLLLLSQHAMVWLIYRHFGWLLVADRNFWLTPLAQLAVMPRLTASAAALAFAFGLFVAAWLAILSFRRAHWSGAGYILAALAVVPAVQLIAVAILVALPRFKAVEADEREKGVNVAHVAQGVLAGMAIIVFAVLVSALTFGAYGWGLFVLTPLLVGFTTGYVANRSQLLSINQTVSMVLAATALGTLALVMFALEGVLCILMAAPLGAIAALIGGAAGRGLTKIGHERGRPLLSLAILPAIFALEAVTPPAVPIQSDASIIIAAQPSVVWQALTSSARIASGPGLVGLSGLAYPIRGRLIGSGVGAIRLGEFSTGVARERVTLWEPCHALAFAVEHQPPAMEEMSPYRRVHAPHVNGYFDTGETRFTLTPIVGGGTRLRVQSLHILRIDPALYWEPIARLAILLNVTRVLKDVRTKAER